MPIYFSIFCKLYLIISTLYFLYSFENIYGLCQSSGKSNTILEHFCLYIESYLSVLIQGPSNSRYFLTKFLENSVNVNRPIKNVQRPKSSLRYEVLKLWCCNIAYYLIWKLISAHLFLRTRSIVFSRWFSVRIFAAKI